MGLKVRKNSEWKIPKCLKANNGISLKKNMFVHALSSLKLLLEREQQKKAVRARKGVVLRKNTAASFP